MSYQFEAHPLYEDETIDHEPTFRVNLHRALRNNTHLIYIGWHAPVPMLDFYTHRFTSIVVVEAWDENVVKARAAHPRVRVLHDDARRFSPQINVGRVCILWQQGPEHVEKHEGQRLVESWKAGAHTIILEAPNGWREQEEPDGNPFEAHRSAWHIEDLEDLGFTACRFMNPDRKGSIIAYWQTAASED